MGSVFSLNGKVAVVTGGAGAIGSAIARGLAEEGATVVLAGRTLASLQEAAEEIRCTTGTEVDAMTVDVSSEDSVRELAEKAIQKYGKIHILVNAHGFNIKAQGLEFPMDEWDRLFATNVKGTMLTCKHFGKHMVANKYGRVINISSVRGVRANAGGNSAYCASKAAVDMITRCLAAEWAPHNVTVNAIGPALMATKLTEKQMQEPGRTERYLANIPLGRLARPNDMVGVAVLLASDASEFITGQTLYVDGGLTAIG